MKDNLMPAVLVSEDAKPGDWNRIEVRVIERPVVMSHEVLVQAEACSVNRADLLQRRGLYPPPPGASEVMGLDFAGSVVETGSQTTRWHHGDRVFGIVAGGGYGRYVAVAETHLVAIPENLDFAQAAAAAEVFIAASYNLFTMAALSRGESLLLHGGGSGVGTAAIQLARSAGATVIATAGSPDKVDKLKDLGVFAAINYKQEDFAARVQDLTGGQGVDVILDWIGASYLERHLDILKIGGRLVIIGLMGGSSGEVNLAQVLMKRLRIIGSVLRSQSTEEKAAIIQDFDRRVVPLLASGGVRPVIDRVFPIRNVEEAHQYLLKGEHFGKIVLTWDAPEA
jgi:putative PIG3 family NAD(P)H quinone oxidoreductase